MYEPSEELVSDVMLRCRVASETFKGEVSDLVSAAVADMLRVGIREEIATAPESNPLVKQAIVSYVKSNFGYDDDDMARFDQFYRRIVCDLMNSSANIAAGGGE